MPVSFKLVDNPFTINFDVHSAKLLTWMNRSGIYNNNQLSWLQRRAVMKNFIKFVKESKALGMWRKMRQQLDDQKQNRQLIGVDRFGNKYYQYYSFHGLPIRRQIRFKNELDFAMKDLVYYQWLHHQVFDPPTEAEKQKFYLQEKIRYEKALEWDRKEEMQMLEFRKRRQQLMLRHQATKQLEDELKKKEKLIDIKTKRQQSQK